MGQRRDSSEFEPDRSTDDAMARQRGLVRGGKPDAKGPYLGVQLAAQYVLARAMTGRDDDKRGLSLRVGTRAHRVGGGLAEIFGSIGDDPVQHVDLD